MKTFSKAQNRVVRDKLIRARRPCGLTEARAVVSQQQIAKLAHISQALLSNFENAKTDLDADTLRAVERDHGDRAPPRERRLQNFVRRRRARRRSEKFVRALISWRGRIRGRGFLPIPRKRGGPFPCGFRPPRFHPGRTE